MRGRSLPMRNDRFRVLITPNSLDWDLIASIRNASNWQRCEIESAKYKKGFPRFTNLDRENRFGNSTCDLSDWDVPSLSLKPYSTDTLPAAGFAVYSRFGRDEPNRLDDATDPHSPSAGRKRCKGGTRVDHKEPLLLGTAGDYGSFQLDAAAVSAAGRPHQSSITENGQ